MALAAVGHSQFWEGEPEPPGPGGNLALYFRYAPHLHVFFAVAVDLLKGARDG